MKKTNVALTILMALGLVACGSGGSNSNTTDNKQVSPVQPTQPAQPAQPEQPPKPDDLLPQEETAYTQNYPSCRFRFYHS
ncbi:hypothetical protein [Mannheimia indoligenes]|uniref:hypothetical protein n=1 Tax=Mannheimia indoligenes TaxID=3103145 RepID=UPI002FE51B03